MSDKTDDKLKKLEEELTEKLAKAAKMTVEEAKEELLAQLEKQLTEEIARRIKQAEEEIKLRADEKAREILTQAMTHGVTDLVAEYSITTVKLPSEEIKGRIIGREGRNIRAFEQATGVEIELDETNEIRLSSFDSVRREIARRALLMLIADARIQPNRIEEVVERVKKEVEKIIVDEGEKLCHALKVYALHPDLVKMLGRYKFRFSYGQNMLVHTTEETKIGVSIAEEIGADVEMVRLACLLHDIGKVVTEEEGSHVQLGVDLLKKYGLPEVVVNAVAEHHEDKAFSSEVSRIVWIADAISGSRPGARYEPHEDYMERMKNIEKIAGEFEGVEEVFAFQAGRDVRVMVRPEKVTDAQLTILVHKIVDKLSKEAQFVGQIKVTGIREVRASAVAS
jgi:ribonuclease Y